MVNFLWPLRSSAIVAAMLITAATISPTDAVTTEPSCEDKSTDKNTIERTCTWSVPGTYYWAVPDDVTSLNLEVYGAQGGSTTSTKGGLGGYMKVPDVKVTPSRKSLLINVGGQGKSEAGKLSGGYNGGGEPSQGAGNTVGGGGGGASEIYAHGSIDVYLAVAGGGGGGGANEDGGAGGGTEGGTPQAAGSGTGAKSSLPGKGGSRYLGVCVAYDGSGKKGGDAWHCGYGAGGGGGGYFGGGGATTGGGGGGGSAFVSNGLASKAELEAGKQNGNGKVVVTFTLPSKQPVTGTIAIFR